MPDRITIGRLGAPYGVKGWFHLQSFTQIPEAIFEYVPWELEFKRGFWKPVECVGYKKHGKGFIAALDGIDTREKVALLTHHEISVVRAVLPDTPKDQFYWSDIEGLEVTTTSGKDIGKVAYLYEAGAADVMVVVQEKQERHIPFSVGDVVQSVDLAKGELVVDWSFPCGAE